jgi:hypothetical protein
MFSINKRKISIRDVAVLIEAQKTVDIMAMLPILEKCVSTEDGTPVSELPFDKLAPIVEAIIDRAVNPK